MNGFRELLAAYLTAHPEELPPADPGEHFSFDRVDDVWVIHVRNGGELFSAHIYCEDLLGWLWLQMAVQQNGQGSAI